MRSADRRRRVTLVTDELLGYTRTGGIGTATSFLAVALGRMGHKVELLYLGEPPQAPLGDEWAGLYETAGVAVRHLPRSGDRTVPSYFARMLDTERALHADPPDVVVAQDLAAPVYTALRMRQLGFGFEDTLFVVYCHGTRRWITDTAQKVRVLPGALAVSLLEQASIELADVAVSPSAYLLRWMEDAGWTLPARSLVIPYLSRSAAAGEAPPERAGPSRPVERIAFFGRLEERKGLRPFAAALNTLEPELLRRFDLEFVGAATPAWPPERIQSLLSPAVTSTVRSISFATELDQPEALARLSKPGTLAVMPSAGETFSNAVYECLERGIPFLASNAGAPPELIAEADHARVLFEPTPDGIAAALRAVLDNGNAPQPARPAFDAADAVDAWREVVAGEPSPPAEPADLESDEWTVVGDGCTEVALGQLRHAQAVSGADIVTCGVRHDGAEHLFLGDPGGLGVLSNAYGTVALVRRSLVTTEEPVWALLARLVLDGARIVSIPRALVESPPPSNTPADALLVREHFERTLPQEARSLARLAAGLGAQLSAAPAPTSTRSRLTRVFRRR